MVTNVRLASWSLYFSLQAFLVCVEQQAMRCVLRPLAVGAVLVTICGLFLQLRRKNHVRFTRESGHGRHKPMFANGQ